MTLSSFLTVVLLAGGCGFPQDGLVARDGLHAPETPGVRKLADVDARAYANFATAVVLHQRSDEIHSRLRRPSIAKGLTLDERIGLQQEAREFWDEAVVLYKVALARDPKAVEVCSQLASGYFDRSSRIRGFYWLKRAVKLDDGDFMLLFRLGMRFEEDRKTSEAVDAYARAEKARDGADKRRMLPLVMLKSGGLCKGAGRFREAAEIYQRFIKLEKQPDDVYEGNAALIELMGNRAPVWRELAEVYSLMGRHLEAAKAYGEAYRLQPEVTRSLAQMALAYQSGRYYALAVEAFRKYIHALSDELEKAPDDEVETVSEDPSAARVERLKHLRLQRDLLQGLKLIVGVYKKRYKLTDSLGAAQRCAAENPTLYQIHFLIGSIYEEKKNLPLAAQAYGRIVGGRKPFLMAYLKLVDVELKQKRYDRVLAAVADGLSAGIRSRVLQTQLNLHLDAAAAVPGIVARYQAATPPNKRDFAFHYVLGLLYEKLKQTDPAIRAFEQTVRRKPEFTDGWLALASLHYLDKDKPEDALKVLKTASGHLPNDEIIWRFMADVQRETGDFAGAVDAMRHVVALNPENTANHLLYAGMMHKAGRTQDAEATIRRKISEDAERAAQWYYIWGTFHVAYTHQLDRAVAVLRQGAVEHPEDFDLATALGDACLKKQDFVAAARALRAAIRINPASITTQLYLSLALEKDGKLDDAEKVLREAKSIYPTSAAVGVELGRFLVRTKRGPDEGIKLIRKAVAVDPKRILSHLALGRAYMRLKRYNDALAAYGEALKIAPDSSDVRRQLAFVYDEMDQFARAELELRKCLQKDPRDDMAANALGYLYAERSVKLDEAKRLVELALKADPENGAYLDSMGWVLYKRGDLNGALGYLKKAVARETDAVIIDHLADVYVKLGRKDLARTEYERAVKLDVEGQTRAAKKLERLKAGKDPLVDGK